MVKSIALGVYSSMVHLFPFRTEKLSLLALMVLPFWGWESKSMPILKSLFSNEGAFFVYQNVVLTSPSRGWWRGRMFYIKLQLISIFKYIDKLSPSKRGIKGEDVFTSLTKACSDYASEWTRDPGRSGFILINSYLFTFFSFFTFF